ncbi:uncharacterized protein N7484_009288 [Penicillium longicatenatum]|uniref:uncharacterized protein n=1 Tax=Penicillium longicatenatum TaxID=1561947 RepID=UPI0025499A0A|nr:uncharacterized protein N7484_009288 [Penicillium longicatenatum]KAJ5635975.1 hypothetical protein N7484_009288 [Penicillium longicatenatum]
MPQNPKFAYEAQEPAFLQRLRGQYGGDTSGRLERPAARNRKVKDPKDEEDDEPVYVDEESNEVITKEEYKALVEPPKDNATNTEDPSTAEEYKKPTEPIAKQSNLTEVGGQRKRKQAKVVGEENKPESEAPVAQEKQEKLEKPKKPKKAKKIKLSFDEE